LPSAPVLPTTVLLTAGYRLDVDQREVPIGYVQYAESYPPEFRYLYQPAPLPPRRHTRLYVLLAILGVLVVVALAVDIPFVRPILQQYPATLQTPDNVADLPRLTDPRLQAVSDQLRADLGGGAHTMAAFYGPVDNPGLGVAVVARARFVRDPAGVATWLANAGVRNVTWFNPGTMGGRLACGTRDSLTVCAWSDYGSLGVVAGANRSADDTAALLRTVRPLVVHRH
jgi:hypothetical protein